VHTEQRNIKETRRASCNTGNDDLERRPVSAIVMPGYSLPVEPPKPTKAEREIKKLLKRFNKGEKDKLLRLLQEIM
jgi:hypothetical protein